MTETGPLRVAIACQGGGSHTAFTAGVLKRLLGAEELAEVDVVGLSGTSGGAVCALLAWSALLDDDPAAAGPRLEAFWADNSATTPLGGKAGEPGRFARCEPVRHSDLGADPSGIPGDARAPGRLRAAGRQGQAGG
jgi:predicted acylesterase/phospholipase RssA